LKGKCVNVYISSTSKQLLAMKELTIYVPQEKLFEVTEILHKHDVMGLTFSEVMGSGRTKHDAIPEIVRSYMSGKMIIPEFVKRSKVETMVTDSAVKEIVDDIMNNLKTGKHAHGYIFVKDIFDAFDISSKVRGEDVLKQSAQ
jgi:nitrogen regulatory protein PII